MPPAQSFPSSEVSPEFAVAPFACSSRADGSGSVRLRVEGELDLANVSAFKHVLHEAQSEAETVLLDLGELAFIDCSALKEILDADEFARQTGRRLTLIRGSGQVDKVMALTGVIDRLEAAG